MTAQRRGERNGSRLRRAELLRDPGHLLEVLRAGNERAREVAADTLLDVRRHMHMAY